MVYIRNGACLGHGVVLMRGAHWLPHACAGQVVEKPQGIVAVIRAWIQALVSFVLFL